MFAILYSAGKKEKKTKHGSVLRHVVLKSVSAQMVSASVSKKITKKLTTSNNSKQWWLSKLDCCPKPVFAKWIVYYIYDGLTSPGNCMVHILYKNFKVFKFPYQ